LKTGFLRATSVVGAMTLLSRITGLVRDTVYSALFGTSPLMDAFLVAFKIPNFLRRITGEGAFSQAFIPVLAEYRLKRSHAEVEELVAGVTGTLGLLLFAITVVGVIAAPVVILLFAPGFDTGGPRYELAVAMLRFTFPYIFFISLTALGAGVLNAYGKFGTAAFNPVILNLVMIFFAAYVAPRVASPGLALAAGVFVSGVVQLIAQWRGLRRLGLLSWPRLHAAHEGVLRVARLMGPAIFGSSVQQFSLLLDTLLASFLVAGSISSLYYADRMVEFPMGVFSIALATVILPGLSAHHAEESPERFNATLDWALRLTVLVSLPAAIALFVLAGPLIATIYGHGVFSAEDGRMAGYALMAYAMGLLSFSLVKVLAPGYFARQNTRTPVRVGLISLSVNMGFNLAVVLPAKHWGFPAPHALLAFSTGLGATVNTVLLYRGLRSSGVYRPIAPLWRRLVAPALIGNLAMAAFLVWFAGDWGAWYLKSTGWRLVHLAGCVAGGGLLYAGSLLALGLRYQDLRVSRAPAPASP
jgi:putative peptidoglycan lipid II flippase